MADEIYKTGRMYVVWPGDPKVKTQPGGIDKMIESIERTFGTYGWCEEVTSQRAGNVASEQAEYKTEEVPEHDTQGRWRGRKTIDDERRKIKERYMQEFGQRAVYEIRVRYVGNVDATGQFKAVKQKARRKER